MIKFYKTSYGEFDSSRKVGPALWPHFDLIFLHDGELTIRAGSRPSIRLSSCQSILIYPNTPFEGTSFTTVSRASVQHFDLPTADANLPKVFKRFLGKTSGFEIFQGQRCIEVERYIDAAIKSSLEAQTVYVQQKRVAMLTIILTELMRSVDGSNDAYQPDWFAALEKWLDRNIQRKISLEDMATYVGISASYFRASFKKHFGISPGAFFLKMKMRRAERLLRESIMPVKEIAIRVGYPDLPHFYRAFNREYGTSPKKFRIEQSVTG